jgi:disulfide bond formation protein DsbB
MNNILQTRSGRWRAGHLLLSLFCFGAIAFALVLQFREMAPPCPLCIFQRLGVLGCGILAALALICPARGRALLWPVLISLAAATGAGISIRHIVIQRAAANSFSLGSCGPDLGYLLEMNSVPNVIVSVLSGHGDCTVIDWQFMGVTLPMLALAGFIAMAAGAWIIRAWSLRASQD